MGTDLLLWRRLPEETANGLHGGFAQMWVTVSNLSVYDQSGRADQETKLQGFESAGCGKV